MVCGEIMNQRRKNQFGKTLEKILSEAYLDPVPLKNFYQKHKEKLDNTNLFDSEIRVYKDQFECAFEFNKRQDYNQCVICFDDLAPEEKCVPFPGCGHNFHFACLNLWFEKKKNQCPVCKGHFRVHFADDLCQKIKTGFIKVSSVKSSDGDQKVLIKKQEEVLNAGHVDGTKKDEEVKDGGYIDVVKKEKEVDQ